jgi:hypothetical protein
MSLRSSSCAAGPRPDVRAHNRTSPPIIGSEFDLLGKVTNSVFAKHRAQSIDLPWGTAKSAAILFNCKSP